MLYSVLLTGGLSSRMGQDKANLKIADKTLLDHNLALLNRMGSDRVLISGAREGYDSIPDVVTQCGPLGGIYSSLRLIKQEYGLDNSPVLIIPVDMPKLTIHALAKVIVGVSSVQACHYENEVFPCVVRATENLYTYLDELCSDNLNQGSKMSMRGVMKYLKARSITAKGLPENVFMNVNCPEDLLKL